jgi:hypothetical protein
MTELDALERALRSGPPPSGGPPPDLAAVAGGKGPG